MDASPTRHRQLIALAELLPISRLRCLPERRPMQPANKQCHFDDIGEEAFKLLNQSEPLPVTRWRSWRFPI